MVKVKYPFPDCTFEAENDEPVVTAALLNIHAAAHTATAIAPSTSARADKLKRPSVLLAGTGEELAYFVTRWNEYRDGTKLTGADIVAQLRRGPPTGFDTRGWRHPDRQGRSGGPGGD